MIPRPSRWRMLHMSLAVCRLLLKLRLLHRHATPQQLVAAATPSRAWLAARPERAEAAAWLARSVVYRLRRLFPQPCLYASLAGYHFLRAADRQAELLCGVRQRGDALEFHAWLTLDGVPCFGPAEASGFVETLRFPGP